MLLNMKHKKKLQLLNKINKKQDTLLYLAFLFYEINLMENDNKNLEQDNNTQSDKKAVADKKNKQEKANTDVKK